MKALTDPYHHDDKPKTRPIRPGPATLTEEQEERLSAAEAVLTDQERRLMWLCIGYGCTLEAAAVAMGLDETAAQALFDGMVLKIKGFQRSWFAGASAAD